MAELKSIQDAVDAYEKAFGKKPHVFSFADEKSFIDAVKFCLEKKSPIAGKMGQKIKLGENPDIFI